VVVTAGLGLDLVVVAGDEVVGGADVVVGGAEVVVGGADVVGGAEEVVGGAEVVVGGADVVVGGAEVVVGGADVVVGGADVVICVEAGAELDPVDGSGELLLPISCLLGIPDFDLPARYEFMNSFQAVPALLRPYIDEPESL
jgi:integrin beta 3